MTQCNIQFDDTKEIRVADPYRIHFMRIRLQGFKTFTDPGLDPDTKLNLFQKFVFLHAKSK